MSKIKIGSIINRFAIIIPLVLVGCHGDSNPEIAHSELVVASALILNPNGSTPLAGELTLETQAPTNVTIFVDGGDETWTVAFPASSSNHAYPVLGLKPNTGYTIAVSVTDQQGHDIALESTFNVVTAPLPVDFPIVDVKTSISELMEPGFILLDRINRGRNADPDLNVYSIIIDKNGDVRGGPVSLDS